MGWFDKLENFKVGTTPKDIANQISDSTKKSKLDDFVSSIYDILGSSSDVTDRNDIINPEKLLEGFDWSTSTEDQAQYNRLLQLLRNYQSQQEASYQEWYNSTEQKVLRDRVAGLNTDILGVSDSQASEAGVGAGSPFEGVTSQEEINVQKQQIKNQRFANLISSIGTIANLASAFSGLSTLPLQKDLLKSQADSQNLGNLASFEAMVGTEISSRLSDNIASAISLGQSLDINEWFGNESNFNNVFEAYAPSDIPAYRNAFANVRKRMQSSLGRAYEQGKVTAENQGSFSSLVADPTYSADQLIQIAQLRPYMEARKELQLARDKYEKTLNDWNTKYREALSVRSAVDAANAQSDYDAEYYRNMDAERQAAYDMLLKESQSIASKMQKAIDSNFLEIYNQNSHNMKGISAAYLFSSGASSSWGEYFASYSLAELQDVSNYNQQLYTADGTPVLQTKDGKFMSLGAPSDFNGLISPADYR